MMMPPGVVAVLLMFSRNHNHVAESLYKVNEDGKYRPWDQLNQKEKKAPSPIHLIRPSHLTSAIQTAHTARVAMTKRARSN